jgi:hypothetical protein
MERGIFPLAAAAVFIGGCCGSPPPSQFPSAADALARMKATYECANGLQGQGKIDHFGEKGRVRGDILVYAINPARVRIDVPVSLGAMAYTLTSDGDTFKLYDAGQNQFLEGPATACNLARLTQVPLPGHVLVTLLRGEAPLLVHEPKAPTIVWDCDHYRVDIPSTRDASQEVHLVPYDDDWDKPWNQQRLKVTQVNVYQRGATVYAAEIGDHDLARTAAALVDETGLDADIPPSGGKCDIEVPRVIRVGVPSSGDDVIFRYTKVTDDELPPVQLNPPIRAGVFDQPTPPGAQVQRADCKD